LQPAETDSQPKPILPLMRVLLLLAAHTATVAAVSAANPAPSSVTPALELVERRFGAAATAALNLTISDDVCAAGAGTGGGEAGGHCFVLSQAGGGGSKVVSITASSMSSLTYGIGYYVRFHCGLTVGWARGGGSYTSPAAWPCHGSAPLRPVRMQRAVPYTYTDNVCTHSHSYVWYGEAEWSAHIDWMALQGVNIFLAMTGQEEIQYKAFLRFGLSDVQIREFFNGPAYLTWSRGQSMQSVGASALPEGGDAGLPRSWMQAQWRLQRYISASQLSQSEL
jgi:alpha-N-acetylglucosaminidase